MLGVVSLVALMIIGYQGAGIRFSMATVSRLASGGFRTCGVRRERIRLPSRHIWLSSRKPRSASDEGPNPKLGLCSPHRGGEGALLNHRSDRRPNNWGSTRRFCLEILLDPVADQIRSSPFADIADYLESRYGNPNRPIRILSLGSGHCGHELALAERLKCAYEITCTDINEALFTEARERAQERGLSLRFEVQDLNFIRISPGYYELIFAHAVLHHVINLEILFLGGHPKPANDGHLKTGQR